MYKTALVASFCLILFAACPKKDEGSAAPPAKAEPTAAPVKTAPEPAAAKPAAPAAAPVKTTAEALFAEISKGASPADKYQKGATFTAKVKTAPGAEAPTSMILDGGGKNVIMASFTAESKDKIKTVKSGNLGDSDLPDRRSDRHDD